MPEALDRVLDTPHLLALAAALGWASGFRLYAAVFLTGMAGWLGWVALPPGLTVLQHPAVLVASRTDPWSSHRQSLALASDWGADFVDAGEAGRIDAESGHGPWPDGLLKLGGFLKRLG